MQYSASDDYQEPDLVCAFNCGFILYSTWAASIPHMVRSSGAPLVFTEYYQQDCRSNLDLVTSLVTEPELVAHALSDDPEVTADGASASSDDELDQGPGLPSVKINLEIAAAGSSTRNLLEQDSSASDF